MRTPAGSTQEISILNQKMEATSHHRSKTKPSHADLILFLLVSQICNIRCRFCYQKSFSPQCLSDDVLYEKLKPLYPRVSFLPIVGGEVTIVPGMKKYVQWVKDNYPHIDILIGTNGVEFDDDWIKLAVEYQLLINFSLNAVSQHIYDRILLNGNPRKIFAKINENLQRLVEAHNKASVPLLNEISMVVTEDTASDTENFIRFALKHGLNAMMRFNVEKNASLSQHILDAEYTAYKLKILCEDFISITPWHNPNNQSHSTIISDIRKLYGTKKEAFLKTVVHTKAKNKTVTFHDYLPPSESDHCVLPEHAISVGFDGTVVPCYNLPNYVLGNIYCDTLDEMLNSKKAIGLRRMLSNGNYRYCFKRCPLNRNPETSVDAAEIKYSFKHKTLFERGDYEKALRELVKIEGTPIFGAYECYAYAFCLHMIGQRDKAVTFYSRALSEGYDEFWVRYNRGSLLLDMGNYSKASVDILRAFSLNSLHEGIISLKDRIHAH